MTLRLQSTGSVFWHVGLVVPQPVESSQTRDQTHVPCIGGWILNHSTQKGSPPLQFYENENRKIFAQLYSIFVLWEKEYVKDFLQLALFIWLCWILVAAHGIFDFHCSMWDVVSWPRSPALGAQSFNHWTTREVPVKDFNSCWGVSIGNADENGIFLQS